MATADELGADLVVRQVFVIGKSVLDAVGQHLLRIGRGAVGIGAEMPEYRLAEKGDRRHGCVADGARTSERLGSGSGRLLEIAKGPQRIGEKRLGRNAIAVTVEQPRKVFSL